MNLFKSYSRPIGLGVFFGISTLVSAQISEPPVILYGEVTHLAEGTSYQVYSGELEVTLQNEADASDRQSFATSLANTGTNGSFSYSLELPQIYLPGQTHEKGLDVGSSEKSYRISRITIDGEEAQLIDAGQSMVHTSFSSRGQQHRLDLIVNLPQVDTDGDKLPDWWEERYGLNPNSASDATSNLDGDQWNALEEFLNGSDPTQADVEATVADATILLPSGGTAGVWFPVVGPTAGLSFSAVSSANVSISPLSFTYEQVLAGELTVSATGDFSNDEIVLTWSGGTMTLRFRALNPESHSVDLPVVWLQGEELVDGSVSEWGSNGTGKLVAFQPVGEAQPVAASSEVTFDGSQFLYLNDSDFDLSDFTVLGLFSLDSNSEGDATLLNSSQLRLSVGGSTSASTAQSFLVDYGESRVFGPALALGASKQISLTPYALGFEGTAFYFPQTGSSLPKSFGSIGARQEIADSSASDFFPGNIRELVLYDVALDAKTLSRVEDYQLSRWRDLTLWDYREATKSLTLSGESGSRNSINGGWARDVLVGGSLDDILRGGPAGDQLTGGEGRDRFQLFPGDGNDTILDFTEDDVLDFSALAVGLTGTPDEYLTLLSEIDYETGGGPVVSTLVKFSSRESVKLYGVALSQADLPRLVGQGTFVLGALRYESEVSLAASESELIETTVARRLTVSRSGSLESEADVYLSFVGAASLGVDYDVAALLQSGVVRKVTFPVGIGEVSVDLTPIQDTLEESEDISIAVLPSAQFPKNSSVTLDLNLEDAPQVGIVAEVPYAQRLGQTPAVIRLTRSGNVAEPLDVQLDFDGTALNGDDYEQIPSIVSFDSGERTALIEIVPADHALRKGAPKLATISVVPDTSQFATLSPWSASVVILDNIGEGAKDYDNWRSTLDPAYQGESALAGDADFIDLFTEYSFGLDPTSADSGTATQVNVFTLDGRFVMEIPTRAGVTDLRVTPESLDGSSWVDESDRFSHSLYPLSGDRVMHVFTSRQAVSEINQVGIFRMNMERVSVPSLDVLNAESSQSFLISSSGWIPSESGGLTATSRQAGEEASFATYLEGEVTVEFEWEAAAGVVEFLVDGVVVATAGSSSSLESHLVSGEGTHKLEWRINYTESELTEQASVSNISIQ